MNNIRNNIKRDFTTIPNALINDNELTDRARFLFCYMAAKPDDWKFYQNKISKDLRLSIETIRKYISELEESGWLSRELVRVDGKFDSYDYTLNGSPCRKNTDTVKNHDGKIPTRENLVLTKEIPLQKNTINKKEIETSIQVNEEFEGMKLIVHDTIPSTQEQTPTPNSAAPPSPRKAKRETKYIYPPTQEELIPLFYAKLQDKKRQHPNIVDCWNWANHQAEAFWLYWDKEGWKIERLNSAIALWVNKAIGWGTFTKPCPIQYKGNPANAQPAQPTKLHVEETKSPEQSKEARKAMFAAAKAELNQIGA